MTADLNRPTGPIIALDTSTAAMAAAIMNEDRIIGEVQSLAERNHSVHVITHLKELLAGSGISGEELAAVAVGSGPGSYTGMRIAASAAKTLAWVWDKPLVAVSSLEAIAFGAWHRGMGRETGTGTGTPSAAIGEREHWVLPIMDARRGQVYGSSFTVSDNAGWSRLEQDGVRLMKDWVELTIGRLEERVNAGNPAPMIWLTGDLSLHEEAAGELRRLGTAAGAEVKLFPYILEGRWIAQLGMQRLKAGLAENPHTFTPNYTQLTEAEVKLKAKQAGEAKA